MKRVFIDIDGVVRDIETPILGGHSQVWSGIIVEGLDFVEYITKRNIKMLSTAPKHDYYDVLQNWIKTANKYKVGLNNLHFLSCQPHAWRPHTSKWLKKHFPNISYTFTLSPVEKLDVVKKEKGWLIDDYPDFSDYSNVIIVDKPYNGHIFNCARIHSELDFLSVLLLAMDNK